MLDLASVYLAGLPTPICISIHICLLAKYMIAIEKGVFLIKLCVSEIRLSRLAISAHFAVSWQLVCAASSLLAG